MKVYYSTQNLLLFYQPPRDPLPPVPSSGSGGYNNPQRFNGASETILNVANNVKHTDYYCIEFAFEELHW